MKKWDLGSYRTYQELKQQAQEHWQKYPPRPIFDDFSVNCTGNYVFYSKNCKECYEVVGAEDSKYLMMMVKGPVRDCYDITGWGDNLSRSYDSYVGSNSAGNKFCLETNIGNLQEGEYCILSSSDYIFGCVSARQAKHCVLNKQYTKEEYEKLVPKIRQHMNDMPYTDKAGRVYRYGEFFPAEMSWAAYNDTLAQFFFPLKKEDVMRQGYGWRDPGAVEHSVSRKAADLPDHIRDVDNYIMQEVISCESCPRAYRIIQSELQFLRAMNLPLPRRCPICRIDGRIARWARQMTLIDRTCAKCSVEFRTPHLDYDLSKVLCKKCWMEATA
jgi:hypothetical protein